MRIAIDVDDTLFDFWEGVVTPKVEFEYGVDLPWHPDDTWDSNPVKDFFRARGEDWWTWMQNRSWLWAQCRPFPGAIGVVEDLRAGGHQVEALTKKPAFAEWTLFKLLARWRLPVSQVTFVPLDGVKAEYTSADLLIDDSWENVEAWAKTDRKAILFARPWNEAQAKNQLGLWNGEIATARTWSEVRQLLKQLQLNGGFEASV